MPWGPCDGLSGKLKDVHCFSFHGNTMSASLRPRNVKWVCGLLKVSYLWGQGRDRVVRCKGRPRPFLFPPRQADISAALNKDDLIKARVCGIFGMMHFSSARDQIYLTKSLQNCCKNANQDKPMWQTIVCSLKRVLKKGSRLIIWPGRKRAKLGQRCSCIWELGFHSTDFRFRENNTYSLLSAG